MTILKNLLPVFLFLVITASAEELHLKDGTILQGERIRDEDSIVVFRTRLGEVRVPVIEITVSQDSRMASAPETPEKEGVDPSSQTLVLMPTAFTPPAGTWSFKDFELIFLTLSYSPTSSTSVAVGALFPIDPTQFELYTFGIKQRLLQTPDGQGAVAVDGDLIKPVGENGSIDPLWTLTLIGSWESLQIIGVHGALGLMGSFDSRANGNVITCALGTDMRITSHAKFIAEFLRGEISSVDGSVDVLNFGVRLHGERLSADICGVRPLDNAQYTNSLFLYPMLNVGYRF